MAWQIGVDVGGTFTDLLALDPERGVFRVAKVPSTPEDQSVGFIAGLAVLETDLAAVIALVHGTTVATNAVLERKGARCGLITTAGFRDVLELGRRTRPNPYGMTGSFEALIPRDLRAEVPERIDAAGRVLTPLDEAAGRREGGTPQPCRLRHGRDQFRCLCDRRRRAGAERGERHRLWRPVARAAGRHPHDRGRRRQHRADHTGWPVAGRTRKRRRPPRAD